MVISCFPAGNNCIRRATMAHAKQASKRKGRSKALPVFGAAAGVSLAMGGGASATAPTANVPSEDTASRPVITLGEGEISEVSIATFYVFDKENAGTSQLGEGVKLAVHRGCGGCGGCRGCRGCGRGCRGCSCGGGVFIGACGGCGGGCYSPCWRWTPAGWVYVCY